jgi:zinc transport system ATP-binding protein
MPKKYVELKDIYAGYDKKCVLKDVSLSIHKGDFIGIIGPNGGGKTTLLRLILGLIHPQKGTIHYGIDRKKIGYLPQQQQIDYTFPISVREIVRSGLQEQIMPHWLSKKKQYHERISGAMEQTDIVGIMDQPLASLSGGQLQRTLLARAIVSEPELLILDEPETYVDAAFEKELYTLLNYLNQKITIMMVSHDLGIISSYVKSIVCVNETVHHHPDSDISEELLATYHCPIDVITHGRVPHRVLSSHNTN